MPRSRSSIPGGACPASNCYSAAHYRRGSEVSSATLARNLPVVLYVFDLLYLDGYDLREGAARGA